ALGHHRDDLIESLLMSTLYSGEIRSMPPKLLTQDKRHIVIRPMVYCQEKNIIEYANEQKFPIIPCNLCGSQENLTRKKVKALIQDLAEQNPKIPANMLHALSNVRKSQLMDFELWDFKNLEEKLLLASESEVENALNEEPFDETYTNKEEVISFNPG
ncbi:MAG TPA: tRNA 2-thiocytidine(32) synthetase TtcA, partial [Gammaproteobacteria bacterium]|nr:tRNA 2-thiocytidine(32) synthetase TtcA [Gammaproteobacteria bacterium]